MSIQCLACNTNNSVSVQQCVACGSELLSDSSNNSSTSYHLRSGTTLKQGDYKIDKLLGEGGFGITYKGTYTKNNAPVAIKEMWPERAARKGNVSVWPTSVSPQQKSQQLNKFKLEASNQQKCNHPNIAQIYDWFDENDTCYIVMEFIEGSTLLSILESRGCLTEQEVVKYFSQVVSALTKVHSNNFLHRDIKPENILINSQDRAVLIDFGAAREFFANQSTVNTIMLTPGYAPYEQYSSTGKRGTFTDFYALFASIYVLLTGTLPIDALGRATSIINKSSDPLIPPRQINPQISASMEQAILKGMRIRADERFQTADEVLLAICPGTNVGISIDRNINPSISDKSSANAATENSNLHFFYNLPTGTILKNGRYKIEKEIGENRFSIIYKGVAISNNVPVVIKEMRPDSHRSARIERNGTTIIWKSSVFQHQLNKFSLEASNQQKCKHSSIPQVYEWFEENDTCYIVMEFIEGKTLLSIFQSRYCLTQQEVSGYFSQIASALKTIHTNNLFHPRVIPKNILIDSNHRAVLIDFTAFGEVIEDEVLGVKTRIYKSPYLSPEGTTEWECSTDFYAFFVSIYEALTGQSPVYAGERVAAIVDKFPDPLIPPCKLNPLISASMEQAIITGMKICPDERFQTADEVLAAISTSSNVGVSVDRHTYSYHLPVGTRLKNDRYKIEKLITENGFDITYQGIVLSNNAPVVIQELWDDKSARNKTQVEWSSSYSLESTLQLFRNFRLAASNQQNFNHPNIAQVYDCFDENETCYIVREFIQGQSLQSILKSRGQLTEQEVIRYFLQVALALKTIHFNNLIHRDVKPHNILIDSQGRAVLIDFYAAREFIPNQAVEMTQILTPGYAPYEQYSRTGIRGPSTDFYAFFASIYELLTGKLPIDAADRAASIVDKSPDPLVSPRKINPQISVSMEQAILKGMRIRADERFQTADEVLAAISPSSSVEILADRYIYSNHLPAGTQLKNSQYRIEKLIGEGGFDITYKGIALSNNAPVVIQEMWPEKSARNGTQVMWLSSLSTELRLQLLSKFRLAARNQQKFNHPNIAKVYDCFDENDTCYIVSEFIQGRSLLSILESRGCLTEVEVVKYYSQILLALKRIHSNNFIFSKISLENILIDTQDRAVLINFSEARDFTSNQSEFSIGGISGDFFPGYDAYEQYSSTAKKGPFTDFYALFASIYELLTGQFPANAGERATSIVNEATDPLIPPRQLNPQISVSMERAILTGMQIRPKDRFQTVDEVLAAIAPLTSVGISVDKNINQNPLNTSSRQVKLISKQPNVPVPEFAIRSNVIIGVFDPGANHVDIDLSSFPGNETISRKHAEIFNESGMWKIKDLGSSNGVFIKAAGQTRFSARITAPTAINDGDEIAIAKVKFQFKTS
jgi:serine/threonine protein kinase